MSKRVGRPSDIPRDGGWGTGVKTKTVRVPVAIAGSVKTELAALEAVRSLVADWDARVSAIGFSRYRIRHLYLFQEIFSPIVGGYFIPRCLLRIA